jgi:hypothetical protein
MPRKDFAAFTRLDASDVNTFLMDQSVMSFAGTATRGSAITEPVEGMVTYLEDLDRYDTYNGSSHVPMGGLTLVKSQTIGSAVSSVTVNDAFSADYDDYKIIISGGVGSANAPLRIALGSSTTGYYWVRRDVVYATSADNTTVGNNDSSFSFVGRVNTNQMHLCAELGSPFLSSWTNIGSTNALSSSAGNTNGVHQVASSFSAFTLSPSTGNITGGTINVYGYKKA